MEAKYFRDGEERRFDGVIQHRECKCAHFAIPKGGNISENLPGDILADKDVRPKEIIAGESDPFDDIVRQKRKRIFPPVFPLVRRIFPENVITRSVVDFPAIDLS